MNKFLSLSFSCLLMGLLMGIRPGMLSLLAQPKVPAMHPQPEFVPAFILNSQTKKFLKQAKYQEAAFSAVHSLNVLPSKNMPAAKQLGIAMQPMAKKQTLQITQFWEGAQTFHGDQSVYDCEALLEKCDSLQLFADEFSSLSDQVLVDYAEHLAGANLRTAAGTREQAQARLEELKQQTAEMHYQRGREMMVNPSSLDSNRTAIAEFEAVKRFVPTYQDVDQQLNMARKAATRRIAILPFITPANAPQLTQIGQVLAQQVEAQLRQATLPLLEVVSSDQLLQLARQQGLHPGSPTHAWVELGRKLGLHRIYLGSIDQIELGNLTTTRNDRTLSGTYKVSEQVVVEAIVDGKPIPKTKTVEKSVKGEATARVTTQGLQDQIWGTYSVVEVQAGSIRPATAIQQSVSHQQQSAQYLGGIRKIFNDHLPRLESGSLPIQRERPRIVATSVAGQISLPIIKGEGGLRYPVITQVSE